LRWRSTPCLIGTAGSHFFANRVHTLQACV
jgi:hypothetical protein